MADQRLFAGAAVRRLRRRAALTQIAMAETLGVSASYLNLIERNQRPVSAALLLKLVERFDVDPRALASDDPAGGVAGLRRRLADPMFADLDIDRTEVEEWIASAPGGASAFARLFDQAHGGGPVAADETPAVRLARQEIERWKNHFADLDASAEALADELRLSGGDLYGAIAERLRVRHQLTIRILPTDVLPDRLRRLDLHARQLQLSEMLRSSSRTFQAAVLLAQLEAGGQIDALASGAGMGDRGAERSYRRHLAQYFAAAIVMPYARFLRACDATGYDIAVLQRRFGAGFEQVAHRLTTLQRVGARGLPFFMLRIDRAGQVSKRYAGASGSPLADGDARCPLWGVHDAFARPAEIVHDLVELEDGTRWLTLAQAVAGTQVRVDAPAARFVVVLGIDARLAGPLAAARGLDLAGGRATPIGLGCAACSRPDCAQRSLPPAHRPLRFNERERGLSAFDFVAD